MTSLTHHPPIQINLFFRLGVFDRVKNYVPNTIKTETKTRVRLSIFSKFQDFLNCQSLDFLAMPRLSPLSKTKSQLSRLSWLSRLRSQIKKVLVLDLTSFYPVKTFLTVETYIFSKKVSSSVLIGINCWDLWLG
jgi:hypothetical protein